MRIITTVLGTLTLLLGSAPAMAEEGTITENSPCYTFNLESNVSGTGKINCALNRQINGTTSGGSGQFEFECADTGTGGNPSAAPDTFNPNGFLVQPGAAGDNEFYFEPGYSCFEFSNSLGNQYPEAMTVTIRDQAGIPASSVTGNIVIYDPFGSILETRNTPNSVFPSGTFSKEDDYSFGPYFQNAPIKWVCLDRPQSGGSWMEATFDDVCIDQ